MYCHPEPVEGSKGDSITLKKAVPHGLLFYWGVPLRVGLSALASQPHIATSGSNRCLHPSRSARHTLTFTRQV